MREERRAFWCRGCGLDGVMVGPRMRGRARFAGRKFEANRLIFMAEHYCMSVGIRAVPASGDDPPIAGVVAFLTANSVALWAFALRGDVEGRFAANYMGNEE